ncbi:hypothetical protein SDJN03_18681, partial [Cucurbita argyrosperma subsp. sororia]
MGCSALVMMTEYSFKLAAAYEGKFEDYPEAVNWYPFERMNVFHSDPERLISFAAAGKDQSFSVPESSSVFRKYESAPPIYDDEFAIKLWECLYLQQSGWGPKVKVKRPADRR